MMTDKEAKDTLTKVQEQANKEFEADKKADPVIVERVNQILHDAIASFPPDPVPVDPEPAIMNRVETELKALASDPAMPKDMAKIINEAASAVKSADKSKAKAAEPAKAPEHAEPVHAKHK